MAISSLLGLGFGVSEILLALLRRAKTAGAVRADEGSLAILWLVIVVSFFLAYVCAGSEPAWSFGSAQVMVPSGCAVFAAGLIVRWYAIYYLGRFFTVDVSIAADHHVVDDGPYRYVRHPSYTGALLVFLGVGVSLHNWGSLALVMLPTGVSFMRRIHIEERALGHALGAPYAEYMARTKRLLPGIY